MSALRLHKGAVPGAEKARQTRRSLQLSRQRASRGSLLQSLRTFLTADSFMYGPLLESPPPPPPVHISSDDDSEPHTPEREQEDGGLEDGNNKAANGKEGTVANLGKNGNGHDETTPGKVQGSQSSKTILSYQRMTRTGRTLKLPAGNGTPTSTAPVSMIISKTQMNGDEGRVLLDEEASSMTNSYDDEGHTMLDNEMACKMGVESVGSMFLQKRSSTINHY